MEHNHENEIGKRLLALLIFIVTLPIVILGLVVFGTVYLLTTVLPSPIERLIYKKSAFFKDLRVPYTMSLTHSFAYKSYKYVKENESLDIVVQDEGYYYYTSGNAVLVLPYYAEYKNQGGKWFLSMKNGGTPNTLEEVKASFQNIIKIDLSTKELKLLVKEKYFAKEDVCAAKSDPVFVFYQTEKDFATIKA